MLKEILTLVSDDGPLQYYVLFARERRHFSFQPTLKNKEAPSFVIHVRNEELILDGDVDEQLAAAAKLKVREILSSMLFDQF
jgi:hypothetical protein